MARPLRIEFPGALFHVMSRGNERQPIVRDEADRQERIDWLRRTVETYGWRLHAFVLMTNHDHLFVETPEANLSAGMHLLNSSYTSYFNRRHRRAGHLFQGRFRGHLIEEEGYYLEVSRYVHLNPVRAKMVRRPEQWRWSSYAGYQRVSRTLAWVTYETVLGEFGRPKDRARRAYAQFVRDGIERPPRSPFADALGGLLVGSERFIGRVRRMLEEQPADPDRPQLQRVRGRPTLGEIVAAVSDDFGVWASDWRPGRRIDDASRAVAAYLARRRFGYPATQIARFLGYRGHSSVNYAVARVETGNERLKRAVKKLEQKLAY
jgi:REP element-mobilizing transposase RayT